jgi:hypothetical protein
VAKNTTINVANFAQTFRKTTLRNCECIMTISMLGPPEWHAASMQTQLPTAAQSLARRVRSLDDLLDAQRHRHRVGAQPAAPHVRTMSARKAELNECGSVISDTNRCLNFPKSKP